MPKIIENARELILCRARERMDEGGYEALTVRELARDCGVGTGTVYNYFSSKEAIVASLLLGDWMERMASVSRAVESESDPMAVVRRLSETLSEFMADNRGIFASPEAIRSFKGAVGDRHATLRAQIAQPLYELLCREGESEARMLADFVGEAVLHWTVEGKSYEELAPVISRLFIK